MGLDLIVEGCAKYGYEEEWRRLVKRSFADGELSKAEAERFQEICIPGYERIGAPRVGHDSAANRWILETRKAKTPEDEAAAWVRLDYIPPHPPLRPHQNRARPNRKAALDPFREPARQLLRVGPRAEHALWSCSEASMHPDPAWESAPNWQTSLFVAHHKTLAKDPACG